MFTQARPVPVPVPVPINRGRCCSIKDIFFSPIRFCGRRWMWVKGDSNNQISGIALKILVTPLLACTTLLSGLIAVIGALALPTDNIPSCIAHSPGGKISLLRRDKSDNDIAREIKKSLSDSGCEYSVQVKSMERAVIDENHYPECIHRYVTVIDPSNTAMTRFLEVLKNQFWNKSVPSLGSLYPCVYREMTTEDLEQLKSVLALHKAVTFSMAFDLAYVRTELGRR